MLNRYRGSTSIGGSNPPPSATRPPVVPGRTPAIRFVDPVRPFGQAEPAVEEVDRMAGGDGGRAGLSRTIPDYPGPFRTRKAAGKAPAGRRERAKPLERREFQKPAPARARLNKAAGGDSAGLARPVKRTMVGKVAVSATPHSHRGPPTRPPPFQGEGRKAVSGALPSDASPCPGGGWEGVLPWARRRLAGLARSAERKGRRDAGAPRQFEDPRPGGGAKTAVAAHGPGSRPAAARRRHTSLHRTYSHPVNPPPVRGTGCGRADAEPPRNFQLRSPWGRRKKSLHAAGAA